MVHFAGFLSGISGAWRTLNISCTLSPTKNHDFDKGGQVRALDCCLGLWFKVVRTLGLHLRLASGFLQIRVLQYGPIMAIPGN